jgi:RNA polymerase sigma factor (sigma-70 family)
MDQPPMTEMDETAWASAWAQGDVRAYDCIVRRYAPLVHARCRRALGGSDADDATQAVFLVLARKGGQAAASPVLAAWLYRVADLVIANAWRDRRRRHHAERSLPPPAMATEAEPAEEPMDSIRTQLDACLADLPARERETVLLHHLAGHSLAEVATLTGSPVSTVKYRLSRGLERLRALLARRGVTVGALAILACLQAEARAEVPAELLRHLHDLAPARTGSAATAVPARPLRWSRTNRHLMTRIALAGAALLLVGTSLTYHLARPPAAAEPAAAPPAGSTGDAPGDIDPAKASKHWGVGV